MSTQTKRYPSGDTEVSYYTLVTNLHRGSAQELNTLEKLKSKFPQFDFFLQGGGVLWANSNLNSLDLTSFHFRGGEGSVDQLKSKVPQSDKFSFGSWRILGTLDQLKPKLPKFLTIFISGGGGGGIQGIMNTKCSEPSSCITACTETNQF